MEDGSDQAAGNFLETTTKASEPGRTRSGSTGSNGGGHKRSFSGSLLSRLSFLRMNQVNEEENNNDVEKERGGVDETDADADEVGSSSSGGPGATAAAGGTSTVIQRRQSLRKTRRRKGSLRKTALLGTGGVLRLEGRDKRGAASRSLEISTDDAGHDDDEDGPSHLAIDTTSSAATPRPMYEAQQSGWPLPNTGDGSSLNKSSLREQDSLTAGGRSFTHHNDVTSLAHLKANTASTTSLNSLNGAPTTSTTASSIAASLGIPTPSSSSESYFPLNKDSTTTTNTNNANMSLRPRPSHHRAKSPLSTHHPIESTLPPTTSEIWDYSETEWWGWIILVVTWLVFVVGMGSCFDVWSWAWDVGETPYAPPELEDDPTLPIVGYYPALIILTAVMAWVWVVVAWVGMKYFRHANISGEDS
ncbi:hypothetical protein FQN54_006646 [Arachnomyces sp. PD_36]|nr:hypothetical protein FQN54_006646 [Arachnomyces sp. PD_36]